MRHDEARLVDRLVAVEQQVEVDRARPPLRADPLAAEAALDVEQLIEQLARGQRRLELSDRVQEHRLVPVAPRLRLDHRGKAYGSDQLCRLSDQALAIAEIRPEADICGRHGRWTITAECSTPRPAGCLRTRSFSRVGSNC